MKTSNSSNRIILQGLVSIILLILFSDSSFANNFELEPKTRQTLNISKSGINRITMLPHRILQVTGDEGKYKLNMDEDGSNIYIMPIAKIGEKIELSIKTSTNHTEDLGLFISDEPGKTLHLKHKSSLKNQILSQLSEVKKMLRSMKEGEVDKYYVKDTNRVVKLRRGIRVNQIKSYRYGDLVGAVLEVKNQTGRDIKLYEGDFINLFKNSKAVTFEHAYSLLPPQSDMKVFIVTEIKDGR